MEKRKKHLASLRNLHAPMDKDEILEHSRKMEEKAKELFEKKKKEREDYYSKHVQSYDYAKFQTKFLDYVLEAEVAEKERLE
mmetsp:Transcript_524/g.575  ORF Transcript_524/g.575 Transcript_524/m.575 type:complete len:82 (+) Transcript_524:675-920(+)